jgi:hypothetical protein
MTAVAIENERETIDPGAAPSERNGAAPTREVVRRLTHESHHRSRGVQRH